MTEWLSLMEGTWPAATRLRVGPWIVRNGQGGGGRVSCATAEADWTEDDIALAEAAHSSFGQVPMFTIRDGEARLDAALAARGYGLHDPVDLFAAPLARLTTEAPRRMATFPTWPMLAITRDLWSEAGIGPERIAVMERAADPKTSILGRYEDRSAGCVFVACNGGLAFVHALHVQTEYRRKGLARDLMRAAALWAAENGAERLALAVRRSNDAALALYRDMGMEVVSRYHYRRLARPDAAA